MEVSKLMNCKTILDYVSNISTISVEVLRIETYKDKSKDNLAVNLITAFNILNKILYLGFGTQKTMPSFIEPKVACSYNTLKDLYNYVFAGKTWNVKLRFSDMQYNKHYRSVGSMVLDWGLVGGGSGGSGATCGYTAKNAPHDIWGSRGVAGGNTVCEYQDRNGQYVTVTARGGSPTEYSYLRASKNNGWSYGNGNNGNNGEKINHIGFNEIFPSCRNLIITCGAGGGGGGAVAGYRGDVGKGSSGADGNGSNGGNATQFGTSEAGVWGGGGGGNANNVSSAGSYNGQRKAQPSQTPQKYFGQYTKGSNTASVGSNPNGMGGAGRAGLRDSPQPALNGGEGGNSGGVINNGTENVFFNQLD